MWRFCPTTQPPPSPYHSTQAQNTCFHIHTLWAKPKDLIQKFALWPLWIIPSTLLYRIKNNGFSYNINKTLLKKKKRKHPYCMWSMSPTTVINRISPHAHIYYTLHDNTKLPPKTTYRGICMRNTNIHEKFTLYGRDTVC